jgi:hypothetical protein
MNSAFTSGYLVAALALAAATTGQAQPQPPSRSQDDTVLFEPQLDTTKPPALNYVLTPAGWYHESCVYEVADSDWVEETAIHHTDGSVQTVPSCPYPAYRSIPTANNSGNQTQASAPPTPVTNTHWATWGNRENSRGFVDFYGEWGVPKRPSATGALIYIFPGLEDPQGNFIIQPVLQYGRSTFGGGDYWSIASWVCGSNCHHSVFVRVDVGHTIDGYMSGSQCSDGVCVWEITTQDAKNGHHTSLSWVAGQVYPQAWVTFEKYGVSSCEQLPNQDNVAVDTQLYDRAGALVTGAWHPGSNHESPNCDYHTSSDNGKHATLRWNP